MRSMRARVESRQAGSERASEGRDHPSATRPVTSRVRFVRLLTMTCAALVVMALIPVAVSGQQGNAPSTESTVVASGQGIVYAVPDRAWITIGAESRASSPREAQRMNADAMRPVQDKLKSAGVTADAIRTVAYDVQYEWDFV